jgi:hypothetical protein
LDCIQVPAYKIDILSWTTLKKLGYDKDYRNICKEPVEVVMKWHKLKFSKQNATLSDFSIESLWNKVKGKDNAKKAWERCTGEEWEDYKGGIKDPNKDLDWDKIKNILANNAKYKEGWDYYQNIRYIGKFYWNVNCDIININGSYPTYLISSRDSYGNLRFRYYYTSFKYNNEDWEIWCLFDNSRYIFLRKIGERIPIPEDGITLDVPVIVPLEYNVMQIIDKALNWLKNQQKEDHTWIYDENNLFKPAMTALASLCFLNYGYDPNKNEFLKNALDTLCNMQNPDGSFGSSHAVYETSMTVIALVAAARMQYKPSNSNLKDIIKKAKNYLIEKQQDEGEGITEDNPIYGGWGYPREGWADLSNTQFALMALDAAYNLLGISKTDNVWKKAEKFISNCQVDGGFRYKPDWWWQSPYGSMTAAGIWSLRLCNIPTDDPRIQNALIWLANNYSIEFNPNRGFDWYYYYLISFTKAMAMCNYTRLGGHNMKNREKKMLWGLILY